MYCTVLRPIPGPDGEIAAGQVVDTSAWRPRNRDVLIQRKYLREESTYGLTPPADESDRSPAPLKRGKERFHG